MRRKKRAAVLASGLLLALLLCAGEAAAQTAVCSSTPAANQRISCVEGIGSASDIRIDAMNLAISLTAATNDGVYLRHDGSGAIDVDLTGGAITTTGAQSYGVAGVRLGPSGATDITLKNIAVKTSAGRAWGVVVDRKTGTGDIGIDVQGGSIETEGARSAAVHAFQRGSGGIDIDVKTAALTVGGEEAFAIYGLRSGAAGDIDISVQGGSLETKSSFAHAIYAKAEFASAAEAGGDIAVKVTDASVTTRGAFSYGVSAEHLGKGEVAVEVSGAAVVAAEGGNGVGVHAHHGKRAEIAGGDTTVDVTIGADARIRAPFGVGVHGRLGLDNAAGVSVTHGGVIEARDAGVLAWAARASGSTADNAARTAPMIHVASSGNIAVGAGVMDAYVREFAAGADGTLSAAERAVLDAIEAENSTALNTALAALPASYTDDWKARARGFLSARGRGATDQTASTVSAADAIVPGESSAQVLGFSLSAVKPTDAGMAAEAAARGILGLSLAGIRALALSHTAIADYVRQGDRDPAILAIAEASRTTQQKAALAAQELLSAAERTVLAAVLTGGDLAAALAALPAAYTDDWKDGVGRHAASYNAGNIRVDVEGGAITAEGNGAEALYAVPHERNGAIAVNVAEGASVTGGANGLYLSGAGAGDGNFRAQSVSIDGEVTGGDGAGVYMKGGGRLTVGATGSVGAESGVAILADGPGDFHAEIAGEVEGGVRSEGAGDFTAEISGMVSGDIHAAGDLTAMISGTVTGDVRGESDLTATISGAVTGDVRSAGDLMATISGTVDGNIEGLGAGDHVVSVSRGGVVTGEIHLAASEVRVDGTVGVVRLDRGGMVSIGPAGVIRGVDGVAVRSSGGAASRLHFSMSLPRDRRIRDAIGDAWIINDGGGTDILVNGVKLHDAERGATGLAAQIGGRAVTVRSSEVILDRDFSALDFIDALTPRAGIYEALPGLLLRMESGRAREARTTAEGSPVWVRLSAAEGSRGAKRSTSASKYDFDSFGTEVGLTVSFPWTSGLAGSLSLRHQKGSAEASQADGKGEIDLAGVGMGAGLSWRGGDGWYLNGDFSVMDYAVDLSSKQSGKLRNNARAIVRSLDVEAGRRLALYEKVTLAPRAWLARSALSMDSFTDAMGARFELVRANRLAWGAGVAAETARPLEVGGGRLALRGSVDVESVQSGEKTFVEVSGERLHAEAESPRLLLALGARWRKGRFTIGGEIASSGAGSDDKTLGARLSLGAKF